MKPTQLANVLIKVFGITLVVRAIPSAVSAGFTLFNFLISRMRDGSGGYHFSLPFAYLVSPALEAVLGILLVLQSKWLVQQFFSDNE